ncbi:CRE-PQN-96 protein [Caenorhabditis remanei]|uniref:CRE-PQN-96 protein n=2 Tax=Caenorhabditis remanei TaxID=31234 RepID=E3MI17_CAERE|nr:CRE-PQN-96 protein [Caenorhabditis remanei]
MYQTYPQQQQQQPGYMPQQPSPPIMGAGAGPIASQQPFGQQPPQAQHQQFQPQFQPYQQQQSTQQFGQGQPQQFQPQQPQQHVPTQSPHPDRESYQTVLPSTVTPGWNDPPPMLPTAGTTPNRLSNMRRRPVDPSITGNVGYGAAPQASNPYGGASPYGTTQQDPQQYQQQQQHQQYQAYQQQQPQYGQQQNLQQYGQQYPGGGAPPQPQHY